MLTKLLRFILFLLPPVFFVTMAVIDLNPSGVRHVRYDFSKDSAVISRFFPANRLAKAGADGQQAFNKHEMKILGRAIEAAKSALGEA
jgi:hypothetical protein